MSSILTNNGAMVALQTLKSINMNLASTQGEISTGKSVATAKDNAAVWAISKVMEADVKGFKGISDSLNLGQSTVAVARQAAHGGPRGHVQPVRRVRHPHQHPPPVGGRREPPPRPVEQRLHPRLGPSAFHGR